VYYSPRHQPFEQEYPFRHERFNLLGPVGPPCKLPLEVFGAGDEEKRACGLKTVLSKTIAEKSIRPQNCTVFSVGSNNIWRFEESVFKDTECFVHVFDCTVDGVVPDAIRSRVKFYKFCLGVKDTIVYNRFHFKTWESLLKLTGVSESPTFLKMDIEGYEFNVMRTIIDSGVHLPLQIAMEMHMITFENFMSRVRSSAEMVTFFQYLHTFGGYYLIDRHDNAEHGCCSEVLLARLDCHRNREANYTDLFRDSRHQHPLFSNAIENYITREERLQSLITYFNISCIMKGSGSSHFVLIGNNRYVVDLNTLGKLGLRRAPILRLSDDEVLGYPRVGSFESLPLVVQALDPNQAESFQVKINALILKDSKGRETY